MPKEIRRVPPDWEHPRYTKDDAPKPEDVGRYRALFDQDYDAAAEAWIQNLDKWRRDRTASGPDTSSESRYYWEDQPPPVPTDYRRRKWTSTDATHYQAYETVSLGTPLTPHFATTDELIDYLVTHGDFYRQQRGGEGWPPVHAAKLVERGWLPDAVSSFQTCGSVIL